MVMITTDFDDEEHKIVAHAKIDWNMKDKRDVVRRIVREWAAQAKNGAN